VQEVYNLRLTCERYPWFDIYKRFSDQEVGYYKKRERNYGIQIGKYVNYNNNQYLKNERIEIHCREMESCFKMTKF